MFFKFTKQCYNASKIIIYKYNSNFNSFFIGSDSRILNRLFLNNFDIRFIETILNSRFTSDISLKENLPSCFNYENSNLTAEHQNIIVSMFSKYFDNYLNSADHSDVGSFMIKFFKEYALMGDCVSTISENVFKDTEWTRNLLMSIYISRYPIFTDKDRLNKLSQGISSTIESVELDTKEQKKSYLLKALIVIFLDKWQKFSVLNDKNN